MKKLIAILAIVTLLVSTFAIPTSAAVGDNVMKNIINDTTTVDGCVIFGGKVENASRVPANMFDGITEYNTSVNSTYASYKTSASKTDLIAEVATLYNVMGEEGKADSKYITVLQFELDKVYAVDSFTIWGQQFDDPQVTFDGFDILVSETGAAGSWTVVHSVTNLSCGQKGSKFTSSPATTADYTPNVKYSASFDTANAKFVAFGMTQPRCQHIDELYDATGKEPNGNPHYFRIAEFAVYEAAPVTTKAPETTAAPTTTAASATTAAPAETPATADATVIVAGMALMAAALLVVTRRRATK